jgi:hypothetical protein
MVGSTSESLLSIARHVFVLIAMRLRFLGGVEHIDSGDRNRFDIRLGPAWGRSSLAGLMARCLPLFE